MMTLKNLKVLLAATALGVGALAYSSPADAYYRGCGWHYGWHKGWHRGGVVASDYDVAPRRTCSDGCSAPIYYSEPVVYSTAWPYGYGYGGYGWGGSGGWGWPF
jgi:hypothetical protein